MTSAGRGWLWPLGLALALALSAGGNVAFMVLASRDASFAVEPDYYRKALEWDRTMAQASANRALGWMAAVDGPAPAPGGRRLVVRLIDRDGGPVDGARMTVEARHGARAAEVVHGLLAGTGQGRYAAELPLGRVGLWELRLRAERGAQVFTQRLEVDLPPGP
ncbi:MAG TPA: FixH family protein [Methylomirabilota bacterium]|nr:FixH family protein [Methylomirabilota bacterium]